VHWCHGRSNWLGKEKHVRVLLVEDHAELAQTVAVGLRREGFAVDIAFDGQDGLDHTALNTYDVIVLDRDLPVMHGDDVCRSLAGEGCSSRILMLTASGAIEDRVEGLSMGADDYLPKPFAFAELTARVRALGRRSSPPLPPSLVHGDLSLDPARRIAYRRGERLLLTTKELAVLELLLSSQGAVVSAEELLERVWDEEADPFTNVVKVTISRLRAKLGNPPVIETVTHAGYRI
jgi:DNA-binding response OmpR family regulator